MKKITIYLIEDIKNSKFGAESQVFLAALVTLGGNPTKQYCVVFVVVVHTEPYT